MNSRREQSSSIRCSSSLATSATVGSAAARDAGNQHGDSDEGRRVGLRSGQDCLQASGGIPEFRDGLDHTHHGRVGVGQGGGAAVPDGQLDEAADGGLPLHLPGLDRLGDIDDPGDVVEHRTEDGDDDVVLGVELVVHRRLVDAQSVGDHLQGRAADSVFGEQRLRRVEHPVSRETARSQRLRHRVPPGYPE